MHLRCQIDQFDIMYKSLRCTENWSYRETCHLNHTHLQPTYFLWNFGEPNNCNNLPMDCVTMLPQSYRRGRWTVASCKASYSYVCEKQREENEGKYGDIIHL